MKAEELRHRMQVLENQELRLRGAALLLLLLAGVTLLIAVLPPLRASLGLYRWKDWYLPLICLALIVASSLFSLYGNRKRNLIFDARKNIAGRLGAKDLSLLDPLTGLLNQQYLDQRVSKEIRWAERIPGLSLTLVLFDLDGFRSLNDRLGRSSGDQVLEAFAELLKKNFRGSDTLIRYGDDQFVVLMPGYGEQKAQIAVDRMQERVNGWNLEHPIEGYQLAFHWGTAAHTKGAQIVDLLEVAHHSLERRKT